MGGGLVVYLKLKCLGDGSTTGGLILMVPAGGIEAIIEGILVKAPTLTVDGVEAGRRQRWRLCRQGDGGLYVQRSVFCRWQPPHPATIR